MSDPDATHSSANFNILVYITDYLDAHFAQFNAAGIHCLCYLRNDDLRIFDDLFEKTCHKQPFVIPLAQREFKLGGYEFVDFNWVVDCLFRLKDHCRMDTQDYLFEPQLGTALLSTPHGWREIADAS